jgi:hypothetical protein
MADLNAYWKQVTDSESFQDLEPEQKEKVRSHLFDKYVLSSNSYVNLPQSQRLAVKKHFDEVTAIQPESMGDEIVKKGKKVIKAVAPYAKAGAAGLEVAGKDIARRAGEQVDLSKVRNDLQDIEATGVEIPGAKKAQKFVKEGFDALANQIEPSEEREGEVSRRFGYVSSMSPVTQFDMARMAATGIIRTAGDMLSGAIPETNVGATAFVMDPVFKYAGSTFLGAPLEGIKWKPKTGLSKEATGFGDEFEKVITKRRIENNARSMRDGPPRPLEEVAKKERMVQAQKEYESYQEWLNQADQAAYKAGKPIPLEGPQGDLHPEAKVNVSQLRDAAQGRLQKLKDEPVRTDSLTNAEDDLHGYYRRRIDKAKVYMMPEGPKTEPQKALGMTKTPGFPLLEEGKPNIPEPLPAPEKAPITPAPEAAPRRPAPPRAAATTPESPIPGMKAKDVVFKMYSAYHPDQTKQALQIRTGTFLSALKDYGVKPNEPLTAENLNWVQKFMEQEHADWQASQTPKPRKASTTSISSEMARLREKGLDPVEVRAEAERLHKRHMDTQGISEYEKAIQERGGIGRNKKDATGRVPEAGEYDKNVPIHLRGDVTPDKMAQHLFELHLQDDASSSTMYRKLSERKMAGDRTTPSSFMDEAERNVEHQMHVDAGFKQPQPDLIPESESFALGGEAAPEGGGPVEGAQPQTMMPGMEAKFPDKPIRDIKDAPTFDLLSDFFKNQGETGGGFSGEEIDPVKKAAQEAIINELVDRAMSLGYNTTQDIMLYAARNAPAELQGMLRKNLHPTLSAFDTHAYKEMEAAKQGNEVAKKGMMDAAQRNYFQKKADLLKGTYKKFKANQQVVLFKDMDEGLMKLENQLFIHDNYRKFSKDELAAQRWYTEGKSPKLESLKALGVPEDQAKRWLNLAKNPTEIMKKARPMTQAFEDEYHDLISEFYDSVGYREDHVTRRWKQPREYLDWEGRTLGNRPNFAKGAKFLSQADGIDAGHEPVTFDIRDDLRASNANRVNVMSRIHAYQKLGASFGPEGTPAIMDESGDAITQAKNAKITPHSGMAPNSWIRFDHVPLLKGLAFHPYYEPALKFMMARPFQGAVPEVLDTLAASTKATKLYGLFHGFNLGEMLFSGVSYRDVFSFSKDRNVMFRGLRYAAKAMTADMDGEAFSKNPIKAMNQLYHSFMTGSGMLANRPLALDMAENGFKFGSADEDMHGILRKFLNKTEDFLKKRIGEGAAKGIVALPRAAVDLQEKALWSYVRPISSMLVYETNLKDAMLQNLSLPAEKRMTGEAIKQAIANQTSKEMGGISYARLMINPKTQQVLQWGMLAPGWMIGRGLMGASVFEKGPEGRQARKQMAKLFVSWFIASNMINYAQTKKHLGKGRFMWDNPEGYRNRAFLEKTKDGSTRYLQLSKGLTEVYDDFMYPARAVVKGEVKPLAGFLARKTSEPVKAAAKVMNWATSASFIPGQEPENPLTASLEMYKPMIASGSSAYGGVPVYKGPSRNKVKGVLDEYYKGGMKNPALFQEAMQMATEEGYDVGKLDRAVRSARTKKEHQAMFK